MTGDQLFSYGEKKYGTDPRWQNWGHHLHGGSMEFHATGTSGEHSHSLRVYSEMQIDAFVENQGSIRAKFEAGIPEALRLTELAQAEALLQLAKQETEKIIRALIHYPELRQEFRSALRDLSA